MSNLSSIARPASQPVADILKFRTTILQTGVDLMLFGVHLTLFMALWAVFIRRRRRPCFMMIAVILLLALSAVAIPVGVVLRVAQPRIPHDPLCPMEYPYMTAESKRWSLISAILIRLEHFISDIVVVYRSWALWPDSKMAKGVLLTCITSSAVGSITDFILVQYSPDRPALETLVRTVPLVATNAITTIMLCIRVWQYYRTIKGALEPLTRKTRLEKILVLLMESGSIYCLIWIIGLVTQVLARSGDMVTVYDVIGETYHCISNRAVKMTSRSHFRIGGSAPVGSRRPPDEVFHFQIMVMWTAVDFVLYGVLAALFVALCSVLARRDRNSSPVIVATTLLFLLATISITLDILFYLLQLPAEYGPHSMWNHAIVHQLEQSRIVQSVNARVSYLISDIIVVWRAWVLWPDSRLVKGLLLLCACGSTVGVTLDCVWVLLEVGAIPMAQRTLTRTLPLLVTNLVATGLVGIRAWQYRTQIKGNLGLLTKRSQVEKVLVLLVESGFVYCLIWAIAMVLQILGAGLTTDSAYGIVSATYPRLAGIYPTAVVLGVAAQRSDAHPVITAVESQPIHFATTADKDGRSTASAEEGSTFDPRSVGLVTGESEPSSYIQSSSSASAPW
ncbi:uncharacterized protein SCHCODRAFT_01190735 [Schizophyllum commune H4-8]|nr:uncharacterized protein SCHCODRAFT_01190735 [Schizophyllum commune H4-8]KAI5890040.1 hypothetical protein SCHCODRAFT_01190735 [Schizophyllum commune H4-8]